MYIFFQTVSHNDKVNVVDTFMLYSRNEEEVKETSREIVKFISCIKEARENLQSEVLYLDQSITSESKLEEKNLVSGKKLLMHTEIEELNNKLYEICTLFDLNPNQNLQFFLDELESKNTDYDIVLESVGSSESSEDESCSETEQDDEGDTTSEYTTESESSGEENIEKNNESN